MIKIPKPVLTACKFACAAIPFIWIFSRVEFDRFIPTIADVRWWTVPLLAAVVLVAMVLQGMRWWILVGAFAPGLTFMQAMSLHFKSLFYSMFLSNSTVQEIVRSVVAIKHVGSVTSWSATWINKITGIVVAYAFSVYGIITLASHGLPRYSVAVVAAIFIVMLLLVVVSFTKKITRLFVPLFKKVVPPAPAEYLYRLRNGIYLFRNKRKEMALALLVTVVVQALLVTGTAMVIFGITGKLFLRECFAFIPLIEMISMAQPFTPNGIGVRDWLVAQMFNYLGMSPEQLAAYVIISNLSILLKLVGAFPVLFDMIGKRRRKR